MISKHLVKGEGKDGRISYIAARGISAYLERHTNQRQRHINYMGGRERIWMT